MESATTAAWVAAAAAVVAGLFAGWSAWASHRSARSAAEAVELERDRRHRELAPRIEVKDSAASTDDELSLVFTNRGPVDYDRVTVALDQADPTGPITSFLITSFLLEDAWVTEVTLDPLPQGIPQVVRYQRARSPASWIAHLRLTCHSGPDKWSTRIQVEVAPPILDTIR